MKNTKESAFISRVSKNDLYDPAKLQEDLDKVRDLYRGAGYKNVVIGDPKVDVRAGDPEGAPTRSAGCSSPSRSRRASAGSSARSHRGQQGLLRRGACCGPSTAGRPAGCAPR